MNSAIVYDAPRGEADICLQADDDYNMGFMKG